VPFTVHTDAVAGLALVRYRELHGVEEIVEAIGKLSTDPELRPLPLRVHDFRDVELHASADELRGLSRRAAASVEGRWTDGERSARRSASIAPSQLTFGLLRMLDAFLDQSVRGLDAGEREADDLHRVVHTFAEAAEWLGLPRDYRDPCACQVTLRSPGSDHEHCP